MIISAPRKNPGFTLAETLISMGIMTMVGLIVFLVLNSGMVLYAKNTAVNSAHQQARTGVEQMLTNLHDSVSIPQLTDATLTPLPDVVDASGQPIPAAGISFQSFDGGPFPVVVQANAADTSIALYCPGYTPPASARLNIPSHGIEKDITSTSGLAGYRQFTFSSAIGTGVDISSTGIEGQPGVAYVITAFMTRRSAYAVVRSSGLSSAFAGELRFYPDNNTANYEVVTRNLVSATPFTIPLTAGGGLQNRYVAAVNLSTAEPQFNQRGYAAVNMFINSLIPFRCRLTNTQ